MENVSCHEHPLLTYATDSLRRIPGLHLIGTANEKAGVLSFVMDGLRTEEIWDYLNRKGIAVRGGIIAPSRSCAALALNPRCKPHWRSTTRARKLMRS
jgi:selenocysteine lyase/cysteine desulfurase